MPDIARIDIHATHEHEGWKLRAGRPLPFGASRVPGGINFSIFSRHATACTLVFFEKRGAEPLVEIPFPAPFRIGDVFAMVVFDVDLENIEYGYRMYGPWDPPAGHLFDPHRILLDPCARAIGGRDVWGVASRADEIYPYRARVIFDDYDWENDHPLETPIEELIIYEMHVRGFTRHRSSGVKHPGTFAAIREKIPYLLELGVNCVELLPIFEFDELENPRFNPETGERLVNYWGYDPVGFFAPKAGYAASGPFGMQVDELKTTIKYLHRNGIEVLLDVVLNHTAEHGEGGATISYRGIDNQIYYMLGRKGQYLDFSGVGNSLDCNNPAVRTHVLDCLRYWASEYHIDGFRFDLAAILGRDRSGAPLTNPPLIDTLANDPILARCKLIAEAWDARGLYMVGQFAPQGRWAEWNDRYRDAVRRFLRGELGQASEVACRIAGSPDLYGKRGPTASINFITCHDGFTLADLVSYDRKHNQPNGEDDRDGADDNKSWNCGHEGPTDDPAINQLRRRQMKNAIAMLMVSQGVPMIVMGDEVGRSQRGNNNPYCQDNDVSWLDWTRVAGEQDLLAFVRRCIAFRRAHPVLRQGHHLVEIHDPAELGRGPAISWHGVLPWRPDHSAGSRTVAFLLASQRQKTGRRGDDFIYVAMNMHWEDHTFELPRLPGALAWHVFVDTGEPAPGDVHEPGREPALADPRHIRLIGRSVVILVGRPA